MNNKEKFTVAASVIAVGFSYVNFIKITRVEQRKRAKINAERKLQDKAMHVATSRVQERIRKGGYDQRMNPIGAIVNDFQFETIAERLKE